MDGSLTDQTGVAGSLSAVAAPGTAAGKVTVNAYTFNGTTQYLQIADAANVRLGAFDWTVAGWFYMTVDGANTNQNQIISNTNFANSKGSISAYFNATIGRLSVSIGNTSQASNLAGNNFNSLATGWHHLIVSHEIAEKRVTFICDGGAVVKVYTGTIGDTTGFPLQFGTQDAAGGRFMTGRLNGWGIWRRKLTGYECKYLYNLGVGVDYPFTGYAYTPATAYTHVEGNNSRINAVGVPQIYDANQSTHLRCTATTFGKVREPLDRIKFRYSNAMAAFSGPAGEAGATHSNAIVVATRFYRYPFKIGGTPTPLTFNAASSLSIPFATNGDTDSIDASLLVVGEDYVVRTEMLIPSGGKMPANCQASIVSNGADGWVVYDDAAAINVATDSTAYSDDGQFHFGPSAVLGLPVTNPNESSVVIRGDSISPYIVTAANAAGVAYCYLGRPNEAIYDTLRTGGDATRTPLTRLAKTLFDQYGVNDLRASRTFLQIKADKITAWTNWAAASGSAIVRIIAASVTPLPAFSTAERNLLNTWLAGLSSNQVSQLIGKQVEYIFIDITAAVETGYGTNVWITSPAALSDDLVHPNTAGYAAIQTRFGQDMANVMNAGVYAANITAASNVLSGVNRGDGAAGTLVLPAAGNVRSGTAYGVGGTGSTGTLDIAADNPALAVGGGVSY